MSSIDKNRYFGARIIMRIITSIIIVIMQFTLSAQNVETELVGVFQGTPIFIQNPYDSEQSTFCISDIYVNSRRMDLRYESSAIILEFNDQELYTPVAIRLISKDSVCQPVILNPDAILFHTSYKFTEISLTDSLLTWTAEGERTAGEYVVEKLISNFWREQGRLPAKGKFEKASYTFEPDLEEGGNKYRVKYEFGRGWYLYSSEIDYDFYPEPVSFGPYKVKDKITLSRFSPYEIYNQESELVLSGSGNKIDVTSLEIGEYVIFFNGKDPGSFTRIRR